MELSIGNKLQPMHFRFENTKHKLGVRIWGDRRSFHELHELLSECWDCESDGMSQAESCSYIGVIYAANPYLMHFMEHIHYKYLRWSTFSRVSLSTLADEMACAAFGTYRYEDFMATLKKQAKKLDCPIEKMRAQVDEWVYEIEL